MMGRIVVMATQDMHVLEFMALTGRVGHFIKVSDTARKDRE